MLSSTEEKPEFSTSYWYRTWMAHTYMPSFPDVFLPTGAVTVKTTVWTSQVNSKALSRIRIRIGLTLLDPDLGLQ